jgi:hypothetical protein
MVAPSSILALASCSPVTPVAPRRAAPLRAAPRSRVRISTALRRYGTARTVPDVPEAPTSLPGPAPTSRGRAAGVGQGGHLRGRASGVVEARRVGHAPPLRSRALPPHGSGPVVGVIWRRIAGSTVLARSRRGSLGALAAATRGTRMAARSRAGGSPPTRPICTAPAAASRARREVRCDRCGHEEVALKTCRRRDGDGTGALCDLCWLPLRDMVWVIPGPVACFGKCARCSGWFSVRDLRGLKPCGRRDAWVGTCEGCVS